MPPLFSSLEEDKINSILTFYLTTLDRRQRNVENIRLMHHKVWSKTRPSSTIIQHRTGSRVEKQTRILPHGKQTDIDYMLEVVGIHVVTDANSNGFFFKPSLHSSYYGTVLIDSCTQQRLKESSRYSAIFTDSCFQWSRTDACYLLIPSQFKMSVLKNSGFEFKMYPNQSLKSPSMPGKGIINEYDTVPCLRMQSWPKSACAWTSRGSHQIMFNRTWREKVCHTVPVFLIATGDPNDLSNSNQFRMSFSVVEIECFKRLSDNTRLLFGLAKYIYNVLLSNVNFLSWFHVKYILFWMVEERKDEYWDSCQALSFIYDLFELIRCAIREGTLRHFFLSDCNIFPIIKRTPERETAYEEIFRNQARVFGAFETLFRDDFGLPKAEINFLTHVEKNIEGMNRESSIQLYRDGYLTRLLSVFTYVVLENTKKMLSHNLLETLWSITSDYDTDECIAPLLPVMRLYCGEDNKRSTSYLSIHRAFVSYVNGDIDTAYKIICDSSCDFDFVLGISVTKLHKNMYLDEPLKYVVNILEKIYGTCPRFYLHPYFFAQHVRLQFELRQEPLCIPMLQKSFSKLVTIAETLCSKTPYSGYLSYKITAGIILQGYETFFLQNSLSIFVKERKPSELSLNMHFQPGNNFDLH